MICTVHKIYSCDEVKTNEMGGTFSTYGGEERSLPSFGRKTLGKEATWKT
jgi:hypothetical protein